MNLEIALISDAEQLSQLTLRSKAYWGYSSEQLAEWKDDLTISEAYIEQATIYKLVDEKQLIGYYSFVEIDANKVKLDNIFLHPNSIGKGYGNLLMRHFIAQVQEHGFESIELDAEPRAEKFYTKFGFKVIGQLESSIKNRFLPVMELKIQSNSR